MIYTRLFVASIVVAISIALEKVIHAKSAITYYNPEYISFVNLTTRRYSRRGVANTNIHAILKHSWGNNVTELSRYGWVGGWYGGKASRHCLISPELKVELVFFEFLSNEYRRSFIQMSLKVCDAVNKNPFITPVIEQTVLGNTTCPYPAGEYHLTNITTPPKILPSNFPFRKFRMDFEITLTKSRGTRLGNGHTFVEVLGKL